MRLLDPRRRSSVSLYSQQAGYGRQTQNISDPSSHEQGSEILNQACCSEYPARRFLSIIKRPYGRLLF